MGPVELIVISLATVAGTFAATSATIACCRMAARRERDRQIFRAYLENPQQIEMWLTEGAIDLLEQTVAHAGDREWETAEPPSISPALHRLALPHHPLVGT